MTAGRGWSRGRVLGALGASACLALGLVSVSVQSYAAIAAQSDATAAGDLVIDAAPHPAEFFDMSPGESRYWSIEASLLGAERGSFALRVFGDGGLVDHPQHPLTVTVEGCEGMLVGDDPREHPACTGAAFTTIVAEQPLADISSDPREVRADDVWALPDILRDRERSFVVTLAVPAEGADDKTLMGLRGRFGVGLSAAGDDEPPVADRPDDLATTGALLPLSLLLVGAGTIALGAVLGRVRTSRRQT